MIKNLGWSHIFKSCLYAVLPLGESSVWAWSGGCSGKNSRQKEEISDEEEGFSGEVFCPQKEQQMGEKDVRPKKYWSGLKWNVKGSILFNPLSQNPSDASFPEGDGKKWQPNKFVLNIIKESYAFEFHMGPPTRYLVMRLSRDPAKAWALPLLNGELMIQEVLVPVPVQEQRSVFYSHVYASV